MRPHQSFSAAFVTLDPFSGFHLRLRADTWRPYIGILGVLLGSVMATLGSRVTTFGIADLRGGLHLGFDEGAWMTTTFGVGQMLVGVACLYLGAIFGVRRVLLYGIGLFFIASFLGPLSSNLESFLAMQFLAGIGSGTFIPLTISFIVRSLPQRLLVYGIAAYAMNSELSQNIGASLEGWYADNWSWRWIDWQYCVALPLMFACIWCGVPREKTNMALARDMDWPGLAYAGLGFSLLYVGLDQGNRLDWTNNGLISGLLVSGALVTLAFVARELWAPKPFLNLRLLAPGSVWLFLLLLAGLRFIILSTAYIIPTYLQSVQNFRELQIGTVLQWIALPQLIIVLPLAALLKRVDGRWVLAFGSALIGIACLMATNLTSDWATDDFLDSQILQALGQSFALTALIVVAVYSMNPADALTAGALLQISRLFGGEIGTAFMQTFVRVREQVHSNLIGLHVDSMTGLTADRLALYRNALAAHGTDVATAMARATNVLSAAVARQAAVLSFVDGFLVAAVGAFLCLVLTALIPSPVQKPQWRVAGWVRAILSAIWSLGEGMSRFRIRKIREEKVR
jgi:MFS transporter, DHA2 family, multidrug resistance protein